MSTDARPWTLPLALVLLGLGSWWVARSLAPPVAAVDLSANYPVNQGATIPGDIRAQNSPVLAHNPVDPVNVVIVNRIDSPAYACALHVSTDGGASFAPTPIPFPAGEEPKCYAPDVAFSADGTLRLLFVTLQGVGNVPNAVWLASSRDGGKTLGTPVRVLGPLSFQVRLTADPDEANRLYLTWVEASEVGLYRFSEPGNPIRFAMSEDGGATWSEPVRVNDPARLRVIAPTPVVGPDRLLAVAYVDLGDDRLDYEGGHEGRGGPPYPGRWALVLARSTDDGATWTETVVDSSLVPTARFIVFTPPHPSIAIDQNTGDVFVAFHDGRLGDSDVWVWASRDGGTRFSDPVRVNDNPVADGTSQYLPALALAPDGRLDVLYYDRREDPNDLLNEVSFQFSDDAGRGFSNRLRLSDGPFDSRVGFGSERGMADLGARLALLSTARHALAAWTDTRAGTEVSAKQDLVRAVVTFSPRSRAPGWLLLLLRAAMWASIGGAAMWAAVAARRLRGDRGAVSQGKEA